jgi:hypothetical protein
MAHIINKDGQILGHYYGGITEVKEAEKAMPTLIVVFTGPNSAIVENVIPTFDAPIICKRIAVGDDECIVNNYLVIPDDVPDWFWIRNDVLKWSGIKQWLPKNNEDNTID